MEIKKVDLLAEAKTLLTLDNKAFHRDYDLPSKDTNEQIAYLRDCEVYIAYEHEQPVGFFAYKLSETHCDLKSIGVIPERQGKKYGKAMMKKLLDITKNNTITLVTHPKNSVAIRMYLTCGFHIYGWKDNFYGDNEPRLLMKLTR